MRTKITGMKFYKFRFPHLFEPLFLFLEPDNEFDKNAIAVYNIENEKLGYIPNFCPKKEQLLEILKSKRLIFASTIYANLAIKSVHLEIIEVDLGKLKTKVKHEQNH